MPRRPTAEVTLSEAKAADAAVQEPEAVVDAAFSLAPPTGEEAGSKQPSRSVRASKSGDFSPTKYGSMKAFKFLDILDEAYRHGFLGFPDTVLEATETLNRDGQRQTTYICRAVALFREDDGTTSRHVGYGEANYENCNRQIGVSALRMAETRAQGRALARALNLDANFDYEMSDPENPGDSAVPNSGSRSSSRSSGGSSRTPAPAGPDPSTFPAPNAPDGETWICEDCADTLPDTTRADGTPYPAGQKAAYSVKHFGRILCATHMRAAKEAAA